MNRDAFLANENDFAVTRHRHDYDGCFSMHDCPRARLTTRGRLHMIGYDFEMCIGEMSLTRNGFPSLLFHARTVAVAVPSGKPCSRRPVGDVALDQTREPGASHREAATVSLSSA